ncbi:MAG: SLOG family protein [Candidatus Ornithomonoglobus sp.]
MKLLIAGSRSIKEFDLSPYIPEDVDTIISGAANGIDALAEQYADKHRLSKIILRPDYRRYRRGAPLKRNDAMVEMADSVLVIWDGVSRGSKHTIDYAKKLNKKISIIYALR